MATLVDSIRMEATRLGTRGGEPSRKALDEATSSILSKAEEMSENGPSLGAETLKGLFGKLEGSMRKAMHAAAAHTAQEKALASFKVAPDASPAEVKTAFLSAVEEAKRAAGDLEEGFEPLAKLRKIVRSASVSRGAGPSGVTDDLDEEDLVMTQASRSTKCPLLQMEMEATGDMRPMKAPCGHTFSFKGINAQLGKKRGAPAACPQSGCNRSFTLSDLVEDKALCKEIKKAMRDR